MSIMLEGLTKRYAGLPVVNNLSLEIGAGEFFVLLGSSGSGKTTVLNMIAGLTSLDQGRILLHDRDVTRLSTQDRRVGFVFQNYGLFQYMNVAENIEFGLKIRKTPRKVRRARRDELLELVGLVGLGDRMPRQLSGGQQQRVALARALALKPDVLLLDEPLGALDAKIRIDLRRSLKRIHRELGVSAILVTHDQEEAFDLADRIGVMSFGRLIEVGTPEDLYQRPQTEFVASFLGTANLLLGQATPQGVQLGTQKFPLANQEDQSASDGRVQVLFRPEDVALAPEAEALGSPALSQGRVIETGFIGTAQRLRLETQPLPNVRPISPAPAYGNRNILIDVTRPPDQARQFPLEKGDSVWIGLRSVHALSHPGLSFLLVTDGSPRSRAGVALAGQIARHAHARMTVLACERKPHALDAYLEEARKELGSGLTALEVHRSQKPIEEAVRVEIESRPLDLIILAVKRRGDMDLAEELLNLGEHHLLFVPAEQPLPRHALICLKAGEPGKDDVLFAGRLLRHLGAEATLLCVLSETENPELDEQQANRFLEGGRESLSLLGVNSDTQLSEGPALDTLLTGIRNPEVDLVVMGAPLPRPGRPATLEGVVGQLLQKTQDKAFLIVRSHYLQKPYSRQ
ncbi:MAG: ATP-binding cassette domain-containing protein [Anaerolineae bacterium]|nr:MAG: ATP-binding cassette domain-containing protein [Anaerolineae bacterium]